MDLKKIKKWILLLAIIICITIMILIIILLNQNKEQSNITSIEEDLPQHVDTTNTIEYVEYNEIPNTYISDMQMCNIYLLDYKNNAIYHTQEAYESLDEDYSKKRFGNFEAYQTYIQEHINEIAQIKLAKYYIEKQEDYTQYICIDQFENYYIFNETAIMQYTVILDTYTTDIPQYIKTYNQSSDTQKVAMCINRFISAIQDENYTYAYTMLSNGFKNNYFGAQTQFENYIKGQIPKKAQITFDSVKSEGDLYMYTVTLQTENETQTITKTFIVRLGQGTNFEISFDV